MFPTILPLPLVSLSFNPFLVDPPLSLSLGPSSFPIPYFPSLFSSPYYLSLHSLAIPVLTTSPSRPFLSIPALISLPPILSSNQSHVPLQGASSHPPFRSGFPLPSPSHSLCRLLFKQALYSEHQPRSDLLYREMVLSRTRCMLAGPEGDEEEKSPEHPFSSPPPCSGSGRKGWGVRNGTPESGSHGEGI